MVYQRPSVHLSKCATDYARSLTNPFTGPEGACIPSYPALMTRKLRVWCKGVMSSGTAGFAYILASPERSAANTTNSVFYSGPTYAGSVLTTSAAAGVLAGMSNSDYPIGSFGATANLAQYRVVSSGLRVRYIGTELNRGGQLIALQEPTHDSLEGYTIPSMDAQDQSVRFKVNERWTTLTYRPITDAETNFSTDPSGGGLRPYYLGMAIQTPPGVTQTYEFEFFTNLEISGQNVRGSTPSHVDLTGYSAVHTVSQTSRLRLPHQETNEAREKSFLDEVLKYASEGLTWVLSHGAAVLTGVAAIL